MHIRTTLKAAAAAVLAAGIGSTALADRAPPYQLGPVDLSPFEIGPAPSGALVPCADPAPLQVTFTSGTTYVPYHGQVPALIIHGVVTNNGPGIFTPVSPSQTAELWVKWGSGAPMLIESVPLHDLGINEWQQFEGAISEFGYVPGYDLHGAPQIILKVVSSVGDCSTGRVNQISVTGPSPSII